MDQQLLSSSADWQRDADGVDGNAIATMVTPTRSRNIVHASQTGSINSSQLPSHSRFGAQFLALAVGAPGCARESWAFVFHDPITVLGVDCPGEHKGAPCA